MLESLTVVKYKTSDDVCCDKTNLAGCVFADSSPLPLGHALTDVQMDR